MNRLRNKIYLGLIVLAFSTPLIIAMDDRPSMSQEMLQETNHDDDGEREVRCFSRFLAEAANFWEALNDYVAEVHGLNDDENDKIG